MTISRVLLTRWRQFTTGTVNREIVGAALTIGLITSLVKVISFFKETILASVFGITTDLDAFIFAFTVVSFFLDLLLNAFQSSFIPVFAQIENRGIPLYAQRFLANTVTFLLIGIVGVIILFIGVLPQMLRIIAYGFSPEKQALTLSLIWGLIPYFFLRGLSTLCHGVLQAGKRFGFSSLVPVFTPLVTIFLLLLSGSSWGVRVLVWATVIGAGIELSVLQFALARRGYSLRLNWEPINSDLRRVFLQTGALMGGTLMMGSTALVDQAMASGLDAGSIAGLNFGNKIPSLLTNITATALATAILPYFSEMVARQDWEGCRHTLKRYTQLLLLTSVPLVTVLILISEPLVRLIFQRGAFDAQAAHLVAGIQRAYLLQAPSYLIGILAVRLISAMGKNQILTFVTGVNMVLNVILNWWFMQIWGVYGIALSTSTVYLVSTILCMGFATRLLK
ncbi:MAG TPA: lipid II flippase MurJ [Candidatus Limnocylindrales bacterium]|nr:lipid II flippase MurJ [Candidatus Limnocylindrales bacterium]